MIHWNLFMVAITDLQWHIYSFHSPHTEMFTEEFYRLDLYENNKNWITFGVLFGARVIYLYLWDDVRTHRTVFCFVFKTRDMWQLEVGHVPIVISFFFFFQCQRLDLTTGYTCSLHNIWFMSIFILFWCASLP